VRITSLTNPITVQGSDDDKSTDSWLLPKWLRIERLTKVEFVRLCTVLVAPMFRLMATAQTRIAKLTFSKALEFVRGRICGRCGEGAC
jgi:hypothetical protein